MEEKVRKGERVGGIERGNGARREKVEEGERKWEGLGRENIGKEKEGVGR